MTLRDKLKEREITLVWFLKDWGLVDLPFVNT